MALTRRTALLGLGGAALGGGIWVLRPGPADADRLVMTPGTLFDAVRAGEVMLVDIRRPDEWQSTGLAEGAVPIDMRRADFLDALKAARPSPDMPIVVICARGVRSRRLQEAMAAAGLAPVIDVPEGMLGSRAGPGWIAAGLPVTNWAG